MNVRIPGYNKKSKVRPDLEFIKESISDELIKAKTDERELTTRRLVKLMCYVLHERYKFGQKRASTVLSDITDLINQGLEYWDGNVGDFWYKIDESLRFMGDNFYPTEDEIEKSKSNMNI